MTENYKHLKYATVKCQPDIYRYCVLKQSGGYLCLQSDAFLSGFVIPWCVFDHDSEHCQFRKHLERKFILISMDS